MAEVEIPEEEIRLLKTAFQFCVQETLSSIAGLTIYTAGYLRPQLEDDEIIGPRWSTIQGDPRLNIARFKLDFFQAVKKSVSTGYVLVLLKNNPGLSSRLVVSVEDSGWEISLFHLADVLWQVLIEPYMEKCWLKNSQVLFDAEIFDAAFEETLADLKAPCIETETYLTPIANMKIIGETIDLAPDRRIRKITVSEVERWMNHWHYSLGERPTLDDYMRAQCAIEITYCRPAGYYSMDNLVNRIGTFYEHVEITKKILGVLRLVTDHPTHLLFTQHTRRGFLERRRDISFPETPKPPSIGIKHLGIDEQLGSEIVAVWNRLQQTTVATELDLSFTRWFGAADRRHDADKLIDYWIGFESLFSPDSTQEVKFRVSLRIAAYLGESTNEREAIYQDMRHSYDWRSAVVHGNPDAQKRLDKRGTLQVTTGNTRAYLRRALLKLLKSDEPLRIDPKESELLLLRRLTEDKPPEPTASENK